MDSSVRTITIFCSAFACIVLAACGAKEKSSTARPQLETKRVRVTKVHELPVEETVGASGALAAHDRAVLSAKVSGRVESIQVDMGSAVKQGDLLARIEKRDYELRKQQAEAALGQARARLGLSLGGDEDKAEPEKTSIVKEARAVLGEATKNRERTLKLRAEGVIPDAEVETAEATYQVAVNRYEESIHEAKNRIAALKQRQAELALVEQQLQDTEIRAPFPGVVEMRQTSPGEFLNVGVPVITVVRIDPIRARLEVSERDAPRIRLGQTTRLRVEGNEKDFAGTISRVSPVIAAESLMLQVEADVPNPQALLKSGSFVKADIVVNETKPGLFVPRSAVSTFAGLQKIFLVREGKATEKEVKLGREFGGQVEVFGQLKAGEWVVVDPGNLRSGQPVETVTSDS